ncbi:matrixin family metalloprotease [archaeon]|nr:matrixin family metalloprotease [archaeon]
MSWKGFLGGVLAVFLLVLIFIYWFIPFNEVQFGIDKNPEFNVGNLSNNMQFYSNMRFPSTDITYLIEEGCPLQKRSEMVGAFNFIQNLTLLKFYPVKNNEEITISCEEESKSTDNGMFISGEGGPTKILSSNNFNVIFSGKILLLRESNCERPNVEIHELLHVLGFDHSENKNNLMYPVSKCSQTIGNDIVDKINELYSFPELPDLQLENISAKISGRYLDINVSVQNSGLKDSQPGTLKIYGDDQLIKEFDLKEIKMGYSLSVSLTNIWVSKREIKELKVIVSTPDSELALDNNQAVLITS